LLRGFEDGIEPLLGGCLGLGWGGKLEVVDGGGIVSRTAFRDRQRIG